MEGYVAVSTFPTAAFLTIMWWVCFEANVFYQRAMAVIKAIEFAPHFLEFFTLRRNNGVSRVCKNMFKRRVFNNRML